jgi:hypothetical protein
MIGLTFGVHLSSPLKLIYVKAPLGSSLLVRALEEHPVAPDSTHHGSELNGVGIKKYIKIGGWILLTSVKKKAYL